MKIKQLHKQKDKAISNTVYQIEAQYQGQFEKQLGKAVLEMTKKMIDDTFTGTTTQSS